MDSQLDSPFRDPLWNLAPFQPTAVHKLPRTRAGRGARPCVRATSTLLETRKQRKHHDEARTDARLLHFFPPTSDQTREEKKKPLWRRRQIQKREKSPVKKKKNPQICFNLLGQSLYPILGCCADREGEVWKKDVLLKLFHSCGQTF